MLSPAPSVSADAELEKNAYKFTLFTLGFSNHEVVAVTPVFPAFAALPGVRLKFTAPPDSETETESLSIACSVIALAPELSDWACACPMERAISTAHTAPSFARRFIAICFGRLCTK